MQGVGWSIWRRSLQVTGSGDHFFVHLWICQPRFTGQCRVPCVTLSKTRPKWVTHPDPQHEPGDHGHQVSIKYKWKNTLVLKRVMFADPLTDTLKIKTDLPSWQGAAVWVNTQEQQMQKKKKFCADTFQAINDAGSLCVFALFALFSFSRVLIYVCHIWTNWQPSCVEQWENCDKHHMPRSQLTSLCCTKADSGIKNLCHVLYNLCWIFVCFWKLFNLNLFYFISADPLGGCKTRVNVQW